MSELTTEAVNKIKDLEIVDGEGLQSNDKATTDAVVEVAMTEDINVTKTPVVGADEIETITESSAVETAVLSASVNASKTTVQDICRDLEAAAENAESVAVIEGLNTVEEQTAAAREDEASADAIMLDSSSDNETKTLEDLEGKAAKVIEEVVEAAEASLKDAAEPAEMDSGASKISAEQQAESVAEVMTNKVTEVEKALESSEQSLTTATKSLQETTESTMDLDKNTEKVDREEVLEMQGTAENKTSEISSQTTQEASENKESLATKSAESAENDVEVVENPTEDVIMLIDSSDDEEPQCKKKAIDNEANQMPSVETPGTKETDSVPMNVHNETQDQTAQDESLLGENTAAAVKPATPEPTAQDSQNPDASTPVEIYYNKECINYECVKKHKQFVIATNFVLSHYKITPKNKKLQYVCIDCYDQAVEVYEDFAGMLVNKQPICFKEIHTARTEFVEIIDSSDDEEMPSREPQQEASPDFSSKDLDLINTELEDTIKDVLNRVDIQSQLTWSLTLLQTRLKHNEEEARIMDGELRTLQSKTDKMFESLYQSQKVKITELQPIDLNTGRLYLPSETPQLMPMGEILRPPIQPNECYYAVKNKPLASWVPCRVIEKVDIPTTQFRGPHYKVKFLNSTFTTVKTVPIKHLAYYEAPEVRLPIGTRVIAYFDATTLMTGKEKGIVQSAFYPGIIAEPLKSNNKFRYLIFYDDGYTQYVNHRDVRLVCHASEKVWEDVHPGSRDFIEKYVTQYNINRPMVQTHKGQSMSTESNGAWLYARVVDIDCSLVKMQFDGPKAHTEWIYRGSLRLGPVFREYHKLQKVDMPQSRLPRRTEPFIRYTEDEEASTHQQQEQRPPLPTQPQRPPMPSSYPEQQHQQQQRAVARKSVSRHDSTMTQQQKEARVQAAAAASGAQPAPPVRHLNNSTIYVEDESVPKGKVVYYTAKRNLPPNKYSAHQCTKNCLFIIQHNLSTYSPLSKPLLSGWERMIMRQKVKKVVVYRAPCGKMLRNMPEIRDYLRATENVLNVENFDFSPETCCLAEYVIESSIVHKRDIANGLEKMALPLVNYYDNTLPPECKYAAQRIPTEGVHLNLDEEFLCGCDCEDDCLDKTKCACWQLTLAGAKYGNPTLPPEDVGYSFKRLYEHVPTGIYECNSRCKCKSNCLNRVVQHSLQMKLQVFKTNNRGWGLRCINDIPRGSFICIYAGYLLTEAKANEGGVDAGDEYFAELDYIEVAEQVKEGYESEVEPPEPDDDDEELYEGDDDADFRPSKSYVQRARQREKPTRQRDHHDNDSQERQVINFNPNADLDESTHRETSIRSLFGKDEACYIMDAKTIGNLGRYFNHSCNPNLFVQNVFVDTHDLRFPWVAFFASTHIRAGTELTWNYNYEVGVVPGKVLYCQCGAPNCRQRLL